MRLSLPSVTIATVCTVLLARAPHSTNAFSITNFNLFPKKAKVSSSSSSSSSTTAIHASSSSSFFKTSSTQHEAFQQTNYLDSLDPHDTPIATATTATATIDRPAPPSPPTTSLNELKQIKQTLAEITVNSILSSAEMEHNAENDFQLYTTMEKSVLQKAEMEVETIVEDGAVYLVEGRSSLQDVKVAQKGKYLFQSTTSTIDAMIVEEVKESSFSSSIPSSPSSSTSSTSTPPLVGETSTQSLFNLNSSQIASSSAPATPTTPTIKPKSLTIEDKSSIENNVENDYYKYKQYEMDAETKVENGVQLSAEKLVESAANDLVVEGQKTGRENVSFGTTSSQLFVSSTTTNIIHEKPAFTQPQVQSQPQVQPVPAKPFKLPSDIDIAAIERSVEAQVVKDIEQAAESMVEQGAAMLAENITFDKTSKFAGSTTSTYFCKPSTSKDEGVVRMLAEESTSTYFSKPSTLEDGPVVTSIVPGSSHVAPVAPVTPAAQVVPVSPAATVTLVTPATTVTPAVPVTPVTPVTPVKQPLTPEAIALAEQKVENDMVRTRADERKAEQKVEKDVEASVEKSAEAYAINSIEETKYEVKVASSVTQPSEVKIESKPFTPLPDVDSDGNYLDALSETCGTAISGSGQGGYLDVLKSQNTPASSGSGPASYLDNMSASTSSAKPTIPSTQPIVTESKPFTPLPDVESNGDYLDALSVTGGTAISGSGQGGYLDVLKSQNTPASSGSGPASYLDNMSASTSSSIPSTPEPVVGSVAESKPTTPVAQPIVTESKPFTPLPDVESNGDYLDALSGTGGTAISGSGQGSYLDVLKTQNTPASSGSRPASYLDNMSSSTSTSEYPTYTPEPITESKPIAPLEIVDEAKDVEEEDDNTLIVEGSYVEGVKTTSFMKLGINLAKSFTNSFMSTQSKGTSESQRGNDMKMYMSSSSSNSEGFKKKRKSKKVPSLQWQNADILPPNSAKTKSKAADQQRKLLEKFDLDGGEKTKPKASTAMRVDEKKDEITKLVDEAKASEEVARNAEASTAAKAAEEKEEADAAAKAAEEERIRLEQEMAEAAAKSVEEERLKLEIEKQQKAEASAKAESNQRNFFLTRLAIKAVAKAAEEERLKLEQEKAEEAARAAEEECRRLEQEKAEEAARAAEEERLRLEQEKEEEAARFAEEERLMLEQEKADEAARTAEEERRRMEQEKVDEAARAAEEERLRLEQEKAERVKAAAKAESNQRKLLEAKLTFDMIEMAQREALTATKAAEEKAEEERQKLEIEKQQKAEASAKAESNQRKLLEARLTLDAAEMEQRKVSAETEEEAVAKAAEEEHLILEQDNVKKVEVSDIAEYNQRRLLEAKLAIDAAEMAQRKALAEIKAVEKKEEAAKAAEEERLELEVDKAEKDQETKLHFAFSVIEEKSTPPEVKTIKEKSEVNGESGSPISEKDEEKAWKIKETKSRTQRIMESTQVEGQTGGAGGVSTWKAFLRAEENWKRLRESKPFDYDPKMKRSTQNGMPPPDQFVTSDGALGNPDAWKKLREQFTSASEREKIGEKYLDFDVVVCGGTLGIFIATALQLKGHKVCVVEGGKLSGREQEWNISMDEMLELVELGVLSNEDLDEAIKTEFPSCRSGFKNKEAPTAGSYFENGIGYECLTPDVLNLGVAPAVLIENVKQRFMKFGGVVKESTPIKGIVISDTFGGAVDVGDKEMPVTARLILDCMGNGSPISRQQRYGMKPDGVCCVVGSCASGYDKETNILGDIIYTNSEIQSKGEQGSLQYFWEAFPVNIGRNGNEPGSSDVKTTYMFTYLDADKDRPDLMTLMEDYWDLLPKYQPSIKDPEEDLDVKRVLFAFFPTYRDSPLKPAFSRVLAVGDASGIQSPLSFGGFGALTRHLDRISGAISESLKGDCLDKEDLGMINPYTPNLSATWMFQKAMSVRMGQKVDPKFVNRLLACNFKGMDDMGIDTIKPFLQDVVRVDGLVGSLARSFVTDPTYMPTIINHVGIPQLVEWIGHVGMMSLYTSCDALVTPVITPLVDNTKNPREKFQWRRRMEAWKFGSGADYVLPRDKKDNAEN